MNLRSLFNNYYTNKEQQGSHSYIELYDILFEPIQTTVLNILEIGIVNKNSTLKLWKNYFTNVNTTIYEVKRNVAYDPKTVIQFHLSDTRFDVIIDDGPHTIRSQKDFIELLQKTKECLI